MLPSGSEEVMFKRTAISDDCQLSIDAATNAGLENWAKK